MDYSITLPTEIDRIDAIVRRISPVHPLHLIDTKTLSDRTKEFRNLFRGTVMYAVKCNASKEVIRTIAKAGIKTFDAASIEEVRLVRKLVPSAKIHFMHTVKSREAIREAYFEHGVRVFVLDTEDELHKIIHETNLAADLDLFIRVALPKNKSASVDFSVKFGIQPDKAALLLQQARLVSARLGIMFHPGTQSKKPDAYRKGIGIVADIVQQSGVKIDALDVGGGFPVAYPGQDIPPLCDFIRAIHDAVDSFGLSGLDLYCEPGRAMVADSGFLVVRVELRKDDALYLNDGVYGGLVEAAKFQGGFTYPTRLIRKTNKEGTELSNDVTPDMAFRFCGPTCDSLDMMSGPFLLPADTAEGDFIVISYTGAYSAACRTNFNGFGKSLTILL